jgi:glycine/D-amino acid oxidase-like deaminating enzyme/nitrite reductase/ring-hydroxylating ferredoxin subunit
MESSETGTTSLWMGVAIQDDGPLPHQSACDVCVVGAGIAGLSVAHELCRRGKSVIVIDDGPIGGGETGRTTAHIVNALDDRYFQIEKVHGAEPAALGARSHTAAIDRIERVCREEGIDCLFQRVDGYLWVPAEWRDRTDEYLNKELEACLRAGVRVERVPEAPSIRGAGPALKFMGQARFHPMRYLAGLTAAIRRSGGKVHTGVHASKIHGGKDAHVETADGKRIACGSVVVATNTPVNDRVAIHTKQSAYRTYVVTLAVPAGLVEPALWWDGFWDDEDFYHYVRTARGARASAGAEAGSAEMDELIVGGEDHKTGQADDPDLRFERLERWARDHFPQAGAVVNRWSGQVMEPHDTFAYIGRNPMNSDNVYIVTGDSGNGMTHGTIAAMIIPDLIEGRDHEWAHLYSPSRISVRSTPEYARENANVFAQYKDWVLPGQVESADDVGPGTGAVVRRGVHRVAVYRDHNGTVFERSARCPHMGCIVHWNPGEKSWDCPCHGSRFDCRGHVINGPANTDLAGPEHARDEETRQAPLGSAFRGTPGTA